VLLNRPFACALVLLFVTSCSSDRTPPDPPPPATGEVGAACADDSTCKTGSCILDPSFPDGYCSLDCALEGAGCPEPSVCHEYLGYKQCMSSCADEASCRQGYVCDYGVCRPPCNRNEVCRAPDVCMQGRCKAGCKVDADCPAGQRCQDAKCLPPCKTDKECIPGNSCNTGSGRCEPMPGKKFGEPCVLGKECATGYCLPTRRLCSVRCASVATCPSGYVCGLEKIDKDGSGTFEGAEADCVPVKGKTNVGAACQKDDDCISGHCYDGLCMEGCVSDSDCAGAGLHCANVNILLDGGIPKYKGCLPRQGVHTFTLGTFKPGVVKGVDIPPNASSFIISTEVPSTSEVGLLLRPTDPGGVVLNDSKDRCDSFSQPVRYLPYEQYNSFYLPNTPSVQVKPGVYSFTLAGTDMALPITVRVTLKLGRADKGTLNINWFFLGLAGTCVPAPTLNAASAPGHSWFGKLRNNMITIMKTAGLSLGKETFQDLKNPALDTIDLEKQGYSPELQQLMASSKGISGNAVNIFVVRQIQTKGVFGAVILGIAGGIPGPAAVHGTVHSGIAFAAETACFEPYGYSPGHTLAHEVGHYLGLFHNQEDEDEPGLDGTKVVCKCPCGVNLSCQKAQGLEWCRGEDPIPDTTTSSKNLMYYAAESTQMFDGNQLTPGQIRVMLDNPVVGY
jgi:hypothetical protein